MQVHPAHFQVAWAPTNTTFGLLLRTYRKRLGLTQWALAERAGVDNSLISTYESGGRRPARTTFASLAVALELTPEEKNRLWMELMP